MTEQQEIEPQDPDDDWSCGKCGNWRCRPGLCKTLADVNEYTAGGTA